MAIKVRCKHCQATFQAEARHAGKSTKCPGCRQPLQIPAAQSNAATKSAANLSKTRAAASAKTTSSHTKKPAGQTAAKQKGESPDRQQIAKQLLEGFQGPLKRTRPTIAYFVGALVVALVMILLPIIYVGLIGLASYGVYYHAINHVGMLTESTVRGRGIILIVLAYIAPIVCGTVLVVFMIKPLFARSASHMRTRSLKRESEPLLFAFVDRICEVVGAARPKRIDLDCQVNASASFRSGFLSMLGNDLVLTIGLPLVAGMNTRQFGGVLAHEFGHFAQGAGMRLTYIIRSISFWLLRVVYQRDEADEWLTNAAATTDIRIGWILYLAMLFVWLSRRVLWCLMVVGHLVGSYLLRQMEFDADRYETRFAGSEAFAQTVLRLQVLGASTEKAYADLREFYREGRLGDDLPQLITSNAAQIPANVMKKIKSSIEERKTGWFDTHPSDRDRIANANRENTTGIFHVELPASVLFNNFEAQSKATTWEVYRAEFGNKLERDKLRPVSEMLAKQKQDRDSQAAIERYFQGQWSIAKPLSLSIESLRPPEQPRQTLDQLKAARQHMLAQIAPARGNFDKLRQALDDLATAEQVRRCLRAGLKIKSDGKRFANNSEGEIRGFADASQKRFAVSSRSLDDYQKLASQRLGHALQLLYVPKIAERIPESAQWQKDGEQKINCLRALGDAMESLLKAARLNGALNVLIEQLSDNSDESLIIALQGLGDELLPLTKQLHNSWARIAYPYDHAKRQMTLAGYLVPTVPIKDDYNSIFSASNQIVDGVFQLYVRLLGDLIYRAEAVETVIGLPRLPALATSES